METKNIPYKQFLLSVVEDNSAYAFTVKRLDGTVFEESDFDYDSIQEAINEAKVVVDEFYS